MSTLKPISHFTLFFERTQFMGVFPTSAAGEDALTTYIESALLLESSKKVIHGIWQRNRAGTRFTRWIFITRLKPGLYLHGKSFNARGPSRVNIFCWVCFKNVWNELVEFRADAQSAQSCSHAGNRLYTEGILRNNLHQRVVETKLFWHNKGRMGNGPKQSLLDKMY